MTQLVIYSYSEDIKKISFTRLIKEQANLSLSKAKQTLDKFLEGQWIVLSFKNNHEMTDFKHKAESLGTKTISKSLLLKELTSDTTPVSKSNSPVLIPVS